MTDTDRRRRLTKPDSSNPSIASQSSSADNKHHRSSSGPFRTRTRTLSQPPPTAFPAIEPTTTTSPHHSHHHRQQPSLTVKSSNDLLGSRFDSAAVLHDLNAITYHPLLPEAGPHHLSNSGRSQHHPDEPSNALGPAPIVANPTVDLSQSLAATGRKMQDVTPPRPDLGGVKSPRQRYSDEAKESRLLKKKTAFSSFFNLSTPRRPAISAPENPVHVTHVGYDQETGEFTVGRASDSNPSRATHRVMKRTAFVRVLLTTALTGIA